MTCYTTSEKFVCHTLDADLRSSRWLQKNVKLFPVFQLDGNAQRLITPLLSQPIETNCFSISNHY